MAASQSRQEAASCEWADFGAMLLAFEGWQFRLELLDPSDEA
jgi:hypothetical protein